MITNWDLRYIELAKHISTWSKDPSTKVGAVITFRNRVISIGFNGLPRGIADTEERLNDKSLKYAMTVHGEMNAILHANRDLRGATLYTYPFMPCSVCAAKIIQTGIVRVVAPYNDNERWSESFKITEAMFNEVNITLDVLHTLLEDMEIGHD